MARVGRLGRAVGSRAAGVAGLVVCCRRWRTCPVGGLAWLRRSRTRGMPGGTAPRAHAPRARVRGGFSELAVFGVVCAAARLNRWCAGRARGGRTGARQWRACWRRIDGALVGSPRGLVSAAACSRCAAARSNPQCADERRGGLTGPTTRQRCARPRAWIGLLVDARGGLARPAVCRAARPSPRCARQRTKRPSRTGSALVAGEVVRRTGSAPVTGEVAWSNRAQSRHPPLSRGTVIVGLSSHPSRPELDADPRSHRAGCLRDRVFPRPLAGPAHHDQVSVAQWVPH